jgi:hypothetical protein
MLQLMNYNCSITAATLLTTGLRRNEHEIDARAPFWAVAVNKRCKCHPKSGKPCATLFLEIFQLTLADVPSCRTQHELDVHKRELTQELWERIRSYEYSPHNQPGCALFDYTRVRRSVLPAAAHTNLFYSQNVYPFLSYDSMALIRAAREGYTDRTKSKKKFGELQLRMREYIETDNGTVEQALVWSSANGGRIVLVLMQCIPHRCREVVRRQLKQQQR